MRIDHLFLFEMIERGKNIIIYGLGNVGKEYIEQIEVTHWCNIIGVSDKVRQETKYVFMERSQIAEETTFDYLVIAIESIDISSHIYEEFIRKGIAKSKILNLNMRNVVFPISVSSEIQNDKLNICVFNGGGFGDVLIDMVFIKKLRELVAIQGEITLCCRYVDYFKHFDEIDNIVEYKCANADKEIKDHSDLIFRMHSIAIVEKCEQDRVRAVSEQLYNYCRDCIKLYEELFSRNANNYRFTKYALLLGKNRIEHVDIHGLLGIKRSDTLKIPMYKENLKCLQENEIAAKRYITVNRDTGVDSDTHTKLWPIKYYIDLLRNIKETYPNICIVLIGAKGDHRLLPYVDKDLTGNTRLTDMNVILKEALLHIECEGGMVHLRHFLGGKSMVFFGPTDVQVFGYDENINLYSESCNDHCAWLTDNWTEKCMKGYNIPKCMMDITPDKAFIAFSNFMNLEEGIVK